VKGLIRRAEPRDIPRIAEILVFGKRVAYRDIFNDDNGSFNELQVLSLAKMYLSDESLIENMLVFDDGIVKGVINGKYDGGSAEICDFYVEPFFKGRGIGSRLLKYFIDCAKENGLEKICLWVLAENSVSRGFYERRGFVTNDRTAPVEGTDKLEIYYELRL